MLTLTAVAHPTRRATPGVARSRFAVPLGLIALTLGVAIDAVCAPRLSAQAAPATGDAVIQAMHDKYAKQWFRTLTFDQKTTRRTAADTMAIEQWSEIGMFPGYLRIDIPRPKGAIAVIYGPDSMFVVSGDSTLRRAASRNILVIIGFDVYTQPVDRTLEVLHGEHMSTTSVREDSWEGRPVYVIGAAAGDLRASQMWIDKDRLVFVRGFAPSPADSTKTLEFRFDDYREVGHGWLAEKVEIYTDGKLGQREEYNNVHTGVRVDPHVFVAPAKTTAAATR
jgi:hypothetical protein